MGEINIGYQVQSTTCHHAIRGRLNAFLKVKANTPNLEKKASMIDLATLCTGEKIQAPKPLKNKLKKLR